MLAATNRDLVAEIAAHRFRADLYYRLNVLPIRCPPLRDRPGDVGLLAEAFLDRAARSHGKRVQGFTPEAMTHLQMYPWPGNVRELENEIERMVTLWRYPDDQCAPGLIEVAHLEERLRGGSASPSLITDADIGHLKVDIARVVRRAEVELIRRALARNAGSRVQAARMLGLSREGLRLKMIRHGMD